MSNNWVIEFKFILKNITMFEIGNEEEETLKINFDNKLVMFGSSLGGAIKNVLNVEDKRFLGSEEDNGESKIIISDLRGLNTEEKNLVRRPGIKINSATGATEDKAKLLSFLVPENNEFVFYIRGEYLSDIEKSKLERIIEEIIKNINSKKIQLGANKTKGFGEFQIKDLKKLEFDLSKNKKDFFRYLILQDNEWKSIPKNNMLKQNDYELLEFEGIISDSILIKGDGKMVKVNNKEDKYKQITEFYSEINCKNNKYYTIPSSTVKGNIRSFLERIVNTMGQASFLDINLTEIFGDNEKKGKVIFYDGKIYDEKTQLYNKIKIDRFTGSAMNGALLTEERLYNLKVNINMRIEKEVLDKKDVKKLFLLYFRDLGMGKITVGSNSSVGAGRFSSGKLKMLDWEISFSSNGEIKTEENVKKEITDLFN